MCFSIYIVIRPNADFMKSIKFLTFLSVDANFVLDFYSKINKILMQYILYHEKYKLGTKSCVIIN